MGRAMVIALSILLLGGVAFAGGDGDRCGKCAEGTVIVKKVADADGVRVEVLAGEEKECEGGKCEGGECKGDGSCRKDGGCEGECGKKAAVAKDAPAPQVRLRVAGNWESLDEATKKQILDHLRSRLQGDELRQALEALVKGHSVQTIVPRHQVEFGVVPEKCPDCAKADGPCETCRERMKMGRMHGVVIVPQGQAGMAFSPKKCPDCAKGDGMCPKCRERRMAGPGPKPGCPCGGPHGMRGMGPAPMRGPGPMRPQAGPGMGMEPILDALNALREEIRAMRRDMMGAHAGMIERRDFDGEDGEGPAGVHGGRGGPSPREERLENQVRELRAEVERLRAHTQKLLERLERLESEK